MIKLAEHSRVTFLLAAESARCADRGPEGDCKVGRNIAEKTDSLDRLPRMEWKVADPGEYSVGFLYDFSSSGGVVMTYADN